MANGSVPTADLVLAGGGVKGIAHVGAITTFESRGYTFQRVAGASAGAIVAAFTAACVQGGRPVSSIEPLLFSGRTPTSVDYSKIPDGPGVPVIGTGLEVLRILTHYGAFPGRYLRDWVRTELARLGVSTFADLKLGGPQWDHLPPNERYRLVVVVTDVSSGSLVRLPWDYEGLYGLDPDTQLVADAVRASASIPFYFEPVTLPWGGGSQNTSLLVDGGACSDFPVEIFDRTDGTSAPWPTFGVKLSSRPAPGKLVNQVSNVLTFSTSLLETVVNGNDQVHLADPCVVARTVFIDTSAVGAEDFDLTADQQRLLFTNGQQAASQFLDGWSWSDYQRTCAKDAGRTNRALAAHGLPLPPLVATP